MEPVQKKHTYQSRSEEVQEILSRPPSWIVRWGTSAAFFFLLILTSIAWLIPSPTIISGKIKLVQQDTQFIAVASFPQNKFAKIKPGQKALIKLDAYDYREFGVLHGTVTSKPDNFDEQKGNFTIYIQLPKSSREYKTGMTGSIEIVVAQKRLIQKFSPF
jgi:hypothetical protein